MSILGKIGKSVKKTFNSVSKVIKAVVTPISKAIGVITKPLVKLLSPLLNAIFKLIVKPLTPGLIVIGIVGCFLPTPFKIAEMTL